MGRAVAFLAGPDARFVTGEALAVIGGAFMGSPRAWTDADHNSASPTRAASSRVRLPRHQKNTPMTTKQSTGTSSVHR